MGMQLIETIELGSSAASITFSSIPQDYTDLLVVQSCRLTGAWGDIRMRFNGSSTGYSMTILYGDGSSAASSSNSSDYLIWSGLASQSVYTADTFGNSQIYIPNYTSSVAKSVSADAVNENNAASAVQNISAGLWTVTDPITSITFNIVTGDNFASGSLMSLYGIS